MQKKDVENREGFMNDLLRKENGMRIEIRICQKILLITYLKELSDIILMIRNVSPRSKILNLI